MDSNSSLIQVLYQDLVKLSKYIFIFLFGSEFFPRFGSGYIFYLDGRIWYRFFGGSDPAPASKNVLVYVLDPPCTQYLRDQSRRRC